MPNPPREVDHRKKPLESRWTRNRRRIGEAQPPAPPPPEPDYEVKGTLNPDATGDYFQDGTHEGTPCYRREDSAWWLWFAWSIIWIISVEVGDAIHDQWERADPDPVGDYDPKANATGTATVQLP